MKIVCLCLLLATANSCFSTMPRDVNSLSNQNTPQSGANVRVKQEQDGDHKVKTLVQRLGSDEELERGNAKKALRSLALESAQSRGKVVPELVKLFQGSDPSLRLSSPAHYDAWRRAAELLGELHATEALDVLIACIECNNGLSGLSFERFPALKAIIAIGPDAVPKLTEALRDGSPATRSYAASALGEIGGSDAKRALENALSSERDKDDEYSNRFAQVKRTEHKRSYKKAQ